MNNIELFRKAFENLSGKKLTGSYITLAEMLTDFNEMYEKNETPKLALSTPKSEKVSMRHVVKKNKKHKV